MECTQARESLMDLHRGRLEPAQRAQLEAHLAECAACRQASAEEQALSELLTSRLPKHPMPSALRERLGALAAGEAERSPARDEPRRRPARRRGPLGLAALAGLAAGMLLMFGLTSWRGSGPGSSPGDELQREAVNDHLRLLFSEHPVEIASGGMHQVKPWFEGRLDFAPVLGFMGDEEFPLEGGAVGYFIDRKAAVFVFKRRLHKISLFVFQDSGLSWPRQAEAASGLGQSQVVTIRGFNVLMWRRSGLGYALVSDLASDELAELGRRLAATTP
ncbi:anti-sigma factor family protein [Hyalangium versicolor]|uniref:anti-sigma factor family protein n=1 Tax=Hyalangium versicolor TaxID=2861190 RepID=UPI001CC9E176|nr:zf-HC2 domain-containing protein [Hyalangium versicolor]